jgi:hypothetical protein
MGQAERRKQEGSTAELCLKNADEKQGFSLGRGKESTGTEAEKDRGLSVGW